VIQWPILEGCLSQDWYLLTVLESGGNQTIQDNNLLSNVVNQSRGAVLAKPFTGTVAQVEVRSWTRSWLGGMSSFAALLTYT